MIEKMKRKLSVIINSAILTSLFIFILSCIYTPSLLSAQDIKLTPLIVRDLNSLVQGQTYAVYFTATGNHSDVVSVKIQDKGNSGWMYVNSRVNLSGNNIKHGPFIFTCRSEGVKILTISAAGNGSANVSNAEVIPSTPEMITEGKKIKDMELFQGYDTYQFTINKNKLNSFRGVHPRLFLDDNRIEEMKKLIATDVGYRQLFDREKTEADKNLLKPVPKTTDERKNCINENLGHLLGNVSITYILTGEQKYLDCASKWAECLITDEYWEDSPDLPTAFLMMGASVAYDWLYNDLDPGFRERLKKKILAEANRSYELCIQPEQWYWNRRFLQNHMWFGVNAMLCGSLAIFDEESRAEDIVERSLGYFSAAVSLLPPDGSAFEGIGYWFYGMNPYFMSIYLAREMLGADLVSVPYFKKSGEFLTYSFLPKNSWENGDVYWGFYDSGTNTGIRDFLLRFLASQYKDGYMAWFADEMSKGSEAQKVSWLSLIWEDPDVKPVKPGNELPTFRHFEDFDMVFARSGWDDDASALMMRCGPPMGNKVEKLYSGIKGNSDVGHVHPDNNHFALAGHKGELLFMDDDYAKPKRTGNHNTLIVNGVGQIGEGEDWFRYSGKLEEIPEIKKAESGPDLDYIVGDASGVYKTEAGVKKYIRHLLFVKPNVLIVVDEIKLARPGMMELRFWPKPQDIVAEKNDIYSMTGKYNKVYMKQLTPEGVDVKVEKLTKQIRGNPAKRKTPEGKVVMLYDKLERTVLRLMKQSDTWENAFSISWSDKELKPAEVKFRQKKDKWIFKVEGKKIEFDIEKSTAKVI